MNVSTVSIPDSLYKQIRQIADQEKITVDQFVASAVAEKMAAVEKEGYLARRARNANEKKFQDSLKQIPDIEPEERDRL